MEVMHAILAPASRAFVFGGAAAVFLAYVFWPQITPEVADRVGRICRRSMVVALAGLAVGTVMVVAGLAAGGRP